MDLLQLAMGVTPRQGCIYATALSRPVLYGKYSNKENECLNSLEMSSRRISDSLYGVLGF